MNFQPSLNRILTYTGRELDVFNLTQNDICIEEIAHSLSMQCRYNGATPYFYSVAQHCIHAAQYATQRGYCKEEVLGLLLHDAAEAYIGDYVRPLKNVFVRTLATVARLGYNIKSNSTTLGDRIKEERTQLLANTHALLRLESNIEESVNAKFGAIRPSNWNAVDNMLAATEMISFFGVTLPDVPTINELLPIQECDCLSPAQAKSAFLCLFHQFTGEYNGNLYR